MRSISFIKKWPLGLFCVLGVIFSAAGLHLNAPSDAIAGTGDNVSGWAWNEKYGWVSFNSFDCDPDEDNLFEGVPSGCPPSGVPRDYGVKIDSDTGDFSGNAWSSNIGWISFNRNDGVTGNPPSDDPGGGVGAIAKYDFDNQRVYGWAKIIALGNDGWLRFDHTMSNYVTIDAAGDFQGWAWNGNSNNTGIGWLSFNSSDAGAGGNYKVTANVNRQPRAENLGYVALNYCNLSVKQVGLNWNFADDDVGDTQDAYGVQVATDSGFANIVAESYADNDNSQFIAALPNYNTLYYWRVQVRDSKGASSTWALPSPISFTTKTNEYPEPSFTVTPDNPSEGQEVIFESTSKYYTGGTESDCTDDQCSYSWTSTPLTCVTIDSPGASTTKATFNDDGSCSVELQVTDGGGSGNSCSVSQNISVKLGLPGWRETR